MKGLTTNNLKIIAIICMLIDHIGFYFYDSLSFDVYYVLRIIGRCAMPIFSFLILQGFLHTKSKTKYFLRLLVLAIITQTIFILLKFINIKYYPNYYTSMTDYFNIVLSFAICIVMLMIIEYKVEEKIYNVIFNILKFVLIVVLLSIYFIVDIDYFISVPAMIIGFYFINKLCSKDIIKKILNCAIIFIVSIISQQFIGIFTLLAFPFILLYNGKLGKKSNVLKYSFYIFFPLHHFILYFLAMIFIK